MKAKKKQCKQGGAAAGTGKNSTYKKTERTSSKDRNYTNYKLYFSVMFYTYMCVYVCVFVWVCVTLSFVCLFVHIETKIQNIERRREEEISLWKQYYCISATVFSSSSLAASFFIIAKVLHASVRRVCVCE